MLCRRSRSGRVPARRAEPVGPRPCRRDSFGSHDRPAPLAAARPPRRPRRQVRRLRRLGDADGVRRRRGAQGAHRRPRGGRRVRRVAPGQGHGARGRARRSSSTPASPTTWAGSAPGRRSTRCAATSDRRRGRRPHRLPARRDHVFLVPNAANTAEVVRRLRGRRAGRGRRSPTSTRTTRCWRCRARARPSVLAALGLPTEHDYMSFAVAALAGVRADRVPHRLHRRARVRAGGAGRRTPARCGTRCWPPARPTGCAPAGLAPGTRCAPRWATRCTARTCRRTSRRCRPGPAGRSAGEAGVLGPGGAARREGGRAAPAAVGPEALDRGIPRAHMAVLRRRRRRSARSPAARSRRPGGSASALALLDTAAGLGRRLPLVEVDVRGRRSPMRVVKPPFVKPSVR